MVSRTRLSCWAHGVEMCAQNQISLRVCLENRLACYDCVTFGEWTHGVQEYYQNGGGISFDFSVAQETKDLWAGK